MGAKPSKGTPADRRLGKNKPSATPKPSGMPKPADMPKPGNCK